MISLVANISSKGNFMKTEKQEFAEYISKHTLIRYESATSLYEFCKALGLTKEEVVDKYGNPESLSALLVGKIIWKRQYNH